MVKTRTEVKLKIKEWIEDQTEPFTTKEVKNKISPLATNILLSTNRLAKYIRASGKAEFDKKTKQWKVKLKPFEKIS